MAEIFAMLFVGIAVGIVLARFAGWYRVDAPKTMDPREEAPEGWEEYRWRTDYSGLMNIANAIKDSSLPRSEVDRTLRMIRSTAVDIQGFIELASRYLVMNMPPEALQEFEPPEHWLKGGGNGRDEHATVGR